MKTKGFTLLELMIVIVLISIITAIALPSYKHYVRKNYEGVAKSTLKKVALQLENEKSRNFSYENFQLPSNLSSLPENGTGMNLKYNIAAFPRFQSWTVTACVNTSLADYLKYNNYALNNEGVECSWKGACNVPIECQ